jgi:hypothetical protein
MTKVAFLTLAFNISLAFAGAAESSGRWLIKVYDFGVAVPGIDKRRPQTSWRH